MSGCEDYEFPSADGRLCLYACHYPGDGPPLLMMHGLTRSSSDFGGLAEHLAGRHQVVVPDQRGRGRSEYDSAPENYVPAVYCADMAGLVQRLGLDRPVLIGTSMGGLMAMVMASMNPQGYRGVVLNDIGPVIEQEGLDRIASYVGGADSIATWQDAAEYCRQTNGIAFPHYGEQDWMAFAERLFREGAGGVPELAYDPAISAGVQTEEASTSTVPPDLWQSWEAMAQVPVLTLRGELSDILSAATLEEMGRRHPAMRAVTVPGIGHAPMLDEPAALEAIEAFLAEVAPCRHSGSHA